MRVNEIASAEDQLALWKLINQSVWAAVEQQRIEQQRQAAQQQAQKAQKAAPKKFGKRVVAAPKPPAIPKPNTPAKSTTNAPVAASPASKIPARSDLAPIKTIKSQPPVGSTAASKNTENEDKSLGLSQKQWR
jgi:hypothetical protein